MNTFELTLDLDKSVGVKQWITLRQGDKRGTTLRATLYDHGVLVSGSYTCRVSIRQPNQSTYYRETATYSNGVATVTIDETSAASVVGVTEGYFELLQGSTLIASTESFGVRILQSATDGATVGPPYDSAIEDALDELDAATGRISQMVVDATAEYLAAHPEITTTVQDNSVTDAKLIQSGGVLDRVGRLWWRLENLLTNTPAEAESVTVADAAKTPVAGLTVFGKSTQDGTPTPDAPVAIESVGAANLLPGDTETVVSTGNAVIYPATLVNLPAGTYTVSFETELTSGNWQAIYNSSASSAGQTTITTQPLTTKTFTFTVNEPMPYFKIYSTAAGTYRNIRLTRGSTAYPYVPYNHVGLWASGRNLLDSNGVFRKATTSYAGCTITNNGDGTYTLSGTNAQSNNWLFHSGTGRRSFNAGTYTLSNGGAALSGCYIGIETSIGTFRIEEGTKYTFTANLPFVVTEWQVMVIGSAAISGTASPMLELGSTTHAYEPYAESVTAIPLDGHTLRSLPDGTRDEVTVDEYGHVTLVQRVGSVTFDGTENFTKAAWGVYTAAPSDVADPVAQGLSGLSTWFQVSHPSSSSQFADGHFTFCNSSIANYKRIYFLDSTIASADAFKAALTANPMEMLYPLATPATHDLGTIDPTALVGSDMTAQAVPTTPFALTYERDLNTTLARLEAAIAEVATS